MAVTRDVVAIEVAALGTDVYVPHFTQMMILAIIKRADELYPLPDPAPYEQPLPDAVVPGDVIPAKENPEYRKAVDSVMLKRNQHLQSAILNSLQVNGCTHEEIVDVYRFNIEQVREYAGLPDDNDFALIMRYCILTVDEYRAITEAATKDMALSQEEIRDGMRIFRRDLQRDSAGGNRKKQGTSRVQPTEQVQAQQSA